VTAKATGGGGAAASGGYTFRLSVMDRIYALRDRWLENPVFQRLCSTFPLTRSIANREAQNLFDLCAGFVYSQILSACVELSLFELLRKGPLSARELALRMSLPEDAAIRLLRAAAALRLVERRSGDRFGLGMLGAAFNGNPAIAAMIRHHAMLYRDLRDPVALLRGEVQTELSRYWAYADADRRHDPDSGDVAPYSALMTASQALISDDVLSAYPLRSHRCLLDVGGGEGAFITAAAARYSNLRVKLFDLPAVARRAQACFERQTLGDRAETFGGSFLTDPLPRGADIISLVRVLHDHDDAAALQVLRAVRDALPDGGVILIAEPFAGTPGAQAMGDGYFGFYLLAMGQGRPRASSELSDMLREAGFERVRQHKTRRPLLSGVMTACR
jgi:demethylspheroidene O-methyltransferase